jgi:DNA-binding transcriptional MerR regulator
MPPFTPPDRGALWVALALTKTQLAALCGLTLRQVTYWTARGYLPPAPAPAGRYNGNAIDLALLIKQGLARGLPLRRAVALARAHLGAELARQPGLGALDGATLAALDAELGQAEAALAAVRRAVRPLVPAGEAPPAA